MKTKQLTLLILVCLVLAAIAILKNKKNDSNWRESGESLPQFLLPESFDTETIATIRITANGKTTTATKGETGWNVKERYGYPVNFNELSRLLSDLTNTRIAQQEAVSAEQLAELHLTPESGAVSVQFLDTSNTLLKELVFGKKLERESEQPAMAMYGMSGNTPLGRYVKSDDGIAIVANTFALIDDDTATWLDKSFFKISDLKSATLSQNAQPIWSVSRTSKDGALTLLGDIPEEKEVDTSKLTAIKSAFSWIRFEDVADPTQKQQLQNSKTLTLTDFDDFIYILTFGDKINNHIPLKLTVQWNGALTRTPAAEEKPEDKAKYDKEFTQNIQANQKKAQELNARLSQWTYLMPANSLSAVDHTRQELLKDKPKPKTEPTPQQTPAPQTPPTPPAPPAQAK